MSNVISASRFGKFFIYDLKQAFNKFGLTVLVTALSPVIAFVIYQILVLLIDGHFAMRSTGMDASRVILAILFTINIFIIGPTKLYGKLTDKRFGSNHLLIPASCFEKWLSMILVTVVVVPFVAISLISGVDWIMSQLFPMSYGDFAIGYVSEVYEKLRFDIQPIHLGPMFLMSYVSNILVFLLGGIFFKKNKIAMTILSLFGLSFVFSTIFGLFLKISNPELYFTVDHDNFELATNLMTVAYILSAIQLIAFGVLTYLRLKKIQH